MGGGNVRDQRATTCLASAVGAALAASWTSDARGRPASALAASVVAKNEDAIEVTSTAREKIRAKVVVRMARSENRVALRIGKGRLLAACHRHRRIGGRAKLEQAGIRDAIIS